MNEMRDWQSLGDEWREQTVSTLDVDALRTEVNRRGRRLRLAMINEVVMCVVALALCAWALRHPGRADIAPAMVIGAMLVLAGFQAWSLWIRRRQLGDRGLDAAAMVALEIERARTSLRYWRMSTWVTLGLWVGLYAAVLSDVMAPELLDPRPLGQFNKWVGSLVGGAFVLLASALWAWWLGRRTGARLVRLRRLQDEMRDS